MRHKSPSHSPKILVLGVSGMLGKTVFTYLRSIFLHSVFGTTRHVKNHSSILKLDAYTAEDDFKTIYKKLESIQYVVNCIGILKDSTNIKDILYVNSLFPHKLEKLAEKYNFRLFHISSDGVFSANSGNVNEHDNPSPDTTYGASKLLGETNSFFSITFRTSILGFDSAKHKGIIEWVLKNKSKTIEGYTNQLWTGCTTLQYATLCGNIIIKDIFHMLRKKSNIFHFAPLEPMTKYTLLKKIRKIINDSAQVKKTKKEKINRVLVTKFPSDLSIEKFQPDITTALKALITFEKQIHT